MKFFIHSFEKHFSLMMTISIFVGLAVGHFFDKRAMMTFMKYYIIVGLFVLLFLSILKTDLPLIFQSFKNVRLISILTSSKLLILPIIVYFISFLLPSQYAPGLVLLAATPAAMSAAGILLIMRGDIHIGLIVTLLTNFLAPFTMPLVLKYTIGTQVAFDTLSMFVFLLIMILGPFVLTTVFKRFLPRLVPSVNRVSGGIITIIASLFIVVAIAPYARMILGHPRSSFLMLILVVGLSLFLHLYAVMLCLKCGKRIMITNIILLAYFNSGLSLVLANQYFDSLTMVMTVMYEFVWAIGFIPLQKIFVRA